MLVLSRKKGEVICVGKDVQIMVTEVKGDRVKIGIQAPPKVAIVRMEVLEREAAA